MTNAEKIAKRAKRGRALLIGAVAAACGLGLYAIVVNVQQGADITKIESPCLRYGAKSQQCKEAFEQAVLTITHPQACAILRKAGLEIRPCAHARLRQEHRRGKERAATASRESGGGGALQTGSAGHQQHGPHGGGHHNGAVHSPGAQQPSGPSPESSPSAPSSPSTGSPAGDAPPSESKSPPDPKGPVEQVTGTAGEAVGNVSKGVGAAAEGAACGTVSLPTCTK